MHLSTDFFTWPHDNTEGSGCDYSLMYRAHEIWRHSKDCLANDPSEFNRIDCISSLRRSINHRLKTLSSVYGLEALPSLRSKKQILEKFQDYGLIRPALIKDLLEVRNLIEHEDAEPPETEKCLYYVDIVWYFLKSTDSLLQMKIDALSYESEDGRCELFVRLKPELVWDVRIQGTVLKTMLSEQATQDHLFLDNFCQKESPGDPDMSQISGRVVLSVEHLTQLARDYFGAAGYWYEDHV
jgi:hypothetical protein